MKQIDPVTWGIWGGIGGTALGVGANLAGHPMPQDLMACAMGGLFWGWVVGNVRNRLAARH